MASNSYWFSAMGTLISASKENLNFCINDALLQGATAVEDKTQGWDIGATQIL